MLQIIPSSLSARTANSNALVVVGKIGLKILRAAVRRTSKMRKRTLRSLYEKPRFSRRMCATLLGRVILLLGSKINRNEIRRFVLDNVSPLAEVRGRESGSRDRNQKTNRDRLISPIPFPRIVARKTTQNRRENGDQNTTSSEQNST